MHHSGLFLSMVCALLVAGALSPAVAAEQGQLTITPGRDVVALTLNLNRGDGVDYSWSADASVDFRLEDLAGTTTFVDRPGQVGSGTFQAPTDGAFTFSFRNRNTITVTVQWTVNLRGALTPTLGILLAASAIVVGGIVLVLVLRRQRTRPNRELANELATVRPASS